MNINTYSQDILSQNEPGTTSPVQLDARPPAQKTKLFHVLFRFFTDMIFLFCEIAGKMPFQDQCLYWHNYFRKLHQVSLRHRNKYPSLNI